MYLFVCTESPSLIADICVCLTIILKLTCTGHVVSSLDFTAHFFFILGKSLKPLLPMVRSVDPAASVSPKGFVSDADLKPCGSPGNQDLHFLPDL